MPTEPTPQLTDIEKEKIRLEEEYKAQLKKDKPGRKSFSERFDPPIKLLQGFAIAVGIFATIWQYMSNSSNERAEAAREYQKSYYQAQMAVYAEAVNATATLSTATPDSTEYLKAWEKFYQLFWGRMSMFEDKCVEAKMVEFRMLLIKFEHKDFTPITFPDPCSSLRCTYDTVDQVTLRKASLRLAHECRIYTIKTWLPKEEQDKYNMDTLSCDN
jgi:hypothetical protein